MPRTSATAKRTTSDQPDAQSYEELYRRLQEIVARLETGDLPLAEALALYEEGTQLAAACQHILDQAELRVHQLGVPEG